jgi:hypothetical protein
MVNGPKISQQEFEDLIDESHTLPTDVMDGIEFIVDQLRFNSYLTRSKIQSLFGSSFADKVFKPGLKRNAERDAIRTEEAIAGAIAIQRVAYADVLSLDPREDAKEIETSSGFVKTGAIVENPTTKPAKDVVRVYNFLRSAPTTNSSTVIQASEKLTNDKDYSRILALQKIADSQFERFVKLGTPVKEYEIFSSFTAGGGRNATEFENVYQKLVDATDAKDSAQSLISGAERDIEVIKQELADKEQELTTTLQTITTLRRSSLVRPLNAAALADLSDAITNEPLIRGEISRLRTDLTTKQRAFRALVASSRIIDKEREIESIRAEITELTSEYNDLKIEQAVIEKSLPALGFTFPTGIPATVANALTQNVTLAINGTSETQTLEDWIKSGRLLQFADRINSMSTKSSRGRVSAQQFLKEATMYHLFGEYKKLNEDEQRELQETMEKFVFERSANPAPAPSGTSRQAAANKKINTAFKMGASAANGIRKGAWSLTKKIASIPGAAADQVKEGLKSLWKNL